MELTQDELIAMATERFGADRMRWAFICPNCHDVATPQDFRDADADPNRIGQECIGRSLGALADGAKRGCDWTAYGLIGGPWSVTVKGPKGERSIFSFALAEVSA